MKSRHCGWGKPVREDECVCLGEEPWHQVSSVPGLWAYSKLTNSVPGSPDNRKWDFSASIIIWANPKNTCILTDISLFFISLVFVENIGFFQYWLHHLPRVGASFSAWLCHTLTSWPLSCPFTCLGWSFLPMKWKSLRSCCCPRN